MKNIFTLLVICLTFSASLGQDIIYLKDNTVIDCALQEVSLEKIKYKKLDNLEGPDFSVKKENTLFTLSKKGYYLVMKELDSSAVAPNSLVEKFNIALTGGSISTDLMFTNKGILRVNIKDDTDPIVYQGSSGLEGSINASDIVAIIYKDGRHKFIEDIQQVAETIMVYKNTPSLDKPSLGKTTRSDVEIGDSNSDITLGASGRISFEEYSRKAVIKN